MNYQERQMQRLIMPFANRRVESVWLSQNRQFLKFVFEDGGTVYWQTEGDCCSSTWIENIDNLDFKGAVLEITNDGALENPPFNKDDYDVIAYYGLTVKTERGRLVIDYRNNSNGYYGGSMELADIQSMPRNTVWREVE